MGSWGTSISGNDTAMDLRSEYQAAFYYFDVETALQKIDAYVRQEGFDESDAGAWCDYYYSLAEFMWKKGILTEEVKQRALELLDSEFGLEIWAETGKAALKERKKVLEKFREKLCSQQPAKKKMSIKLYMKPIFEVGDVVALQLRTADQTYLSKEHTHGWLYSQFDERFFRSCHGKWIAMRKVFDDVSYCSEIVPEVRDIWPCFQLYAAVFDACPTMEQLTGIGWANTRYHSEYGLFYTEGTLSHFKKRNYRVIGSSTEGIDIRDKIGMNKDGAFFGSSTETYNADTVLLNAIVG